MDEKNSAENTSKLNVRIRFFGAIRAVTGSVEAEIEAPVGCSISNLLKQLSVNYGSAFFDEVFQQPGDEPRDDLIVLINGFNTGREQLINAVINDGDVIALMQTFPGGG